MNDTIIPDLEAARFEHQRLQRQIGVVHVLRTRGALHLQNIPPTVRYRHQEVHPAGSAAVPEGCFIEGAALRQRALGVGDHAIPTPDTRPDFETSGEELLGQISDVVPLIESRLCGRIHAGDPLPGMDLRPQPLGTLKARKKPGFGERASGLLGHRAEFILFIAVPTGTLRLFDALYS